LQVGLRPEARAVTNQCRGAGAAHGTINSFYFSHSDAAGAILRGRRPCARRGALSFFGPAIRHTPAVRKPIPRSGTPNPVHTAGRGRWNPGGCAEKPDVVARTASNTPSIGFVLTARLGAAIRMPEIIPPPECLRTSAATKTTGTPLGLAALCGIRTSGRHYVAWARSPRAANECRGP